MKLPEKIRKLRTSREWTQAELAQRLDISAGHVLKLENGKYHPSIQLLKKISDTFEVSTDFMLDDLSDEYVAKNDDYFSKKLKLISLLPEKEKQAIITVIDSMLK